MKPMANLNAELATALRRLERLKQKIDRFERWPSLRKIAVYAPLKLVFWWKRRERWWTLKWWQRAKIGADHRIVGFEFLIFSLTMTLPRKVPCHESKDDQSTETRTAIA